MSGIKFYVIDTETTGLSVSLHEVVEIGIVRFDDRNILYKKIKAERPETASFDALKITGKTLQDLKEGYSKQEIVNECNKFFNEDGLTPAHRCIIAHNASFDRKFVHAMWDSCDQSFPANLWLDTISLTKFYAKKIGLVKPKVNLQAACDILGIKKVASFHNASSDSKNTYLLFKSLIEEKNIDYLPFIKTEIHNNKPEIDESIFEDE